MTNYIIKTAKPRDDLKRINDYFLTFLGEIKLPKLQLEANSITLACPDDDSTTIPLIRNLNLRIFSPVLKAFLPQDPNLLPINQTSPIFKLYGLKPIFRYQNSLVFFCQDKRGQIHLINRHLLEYFSSNPAPNVVRDKHFSLVVAKNIGQFIALIDRGLIPLDYYARAPLTRAIKRYTYFQFDKSSQKFIQTGQELDHAPKKYLAIKVNQDVNFINKAGRLTPLLNVSVFLA